MAPCVSQNMTMGKLNCYQWFSLEGGPRGQFTSAESQPGSLAKGEVLVLCLIISEELSQSFFSSRSCERIFKGGTSVKDRTRVFVRKPREKIWPFLCRSLLNSVE